MTRVENVTAAGAITINPDGSISPPGSSIMRNGDLYSLTGNISDQIVVLRDNIVMDGSGYTVKVTGDAAINLPSTKNVTLRNFVVVDSEDGILLSHTRDIKISRNKILNCSYGIFLQFSDDNKIEKNTMLDNNVGIWLRECSGNSFCHNNFLNNLMQVAIFSSYGNSWDNGLEGNYWDSHHGLDLDKDGIDEVTDYGLGSYDVDNHPLMGEFKEFESLGLSIISNASVISAAMTDQLTPRLGASLNAVFCRIRFPSDLVEAPYLVEARAPNIEESLEYKTLETNETVTTIYFECSYSGEMIITVNSGISPPLDWRLFLAVGLGAATLIFLLIAIGRRRKQEASTPSDRLPADPLKRATILFERDVNRRRPRMEEFRRKHGVPIRRDIDDLGGALERIGIKRKSKQAD